MRQYLLLMIQFLCFFLVGCDTSPPRVAAKTPPTSIDSSATADNQNAFAPAGKASGMTDSNTGDTESLSDNTKEPTAAPKVRQFTFHYKFRVKDLQPSGEAKKDLVRVWLPCPVSTDCQLVTRLDAVAPAALSEHHETRFGNLLLYFETPIPTDGGFTVDIPYEVVRHEVLRAAPLHVDADQLSDDLRAVFLTADKLVPITGKPLKMLEAVELRNEPLALARQLYDVVDEHVVYKKEGTGWGRGDTNWVCDSGYGNCTDFHSLFISLARSQGLPSRFEIGFSIPTEKREGPIPGYHCWAWFYVNDRGWVPVDISEADKHPELKEYYFGNLTADRVMFSVGRDLELVPQTNQAPANFLIYPYIEVGGEVLPKENVELQFSFQDK